MMLCATVAVYRAQAQNSAKQDCASINYCGIGSPAYCGGYCNDNACTVITWSCVVCAPPGAIWCFNADSTRICCPDTGIWFANCTAGTCSLTCVNQPNGVNQQAN